MTNIMDDKLFEILDAPRRRNDGIRYTSAEVTTLYRACNDVLLWMDPTQLSHAHDRADRVTFRLIDYLETGITEAEWRENFSRDERAAFYDLILSPRPLEKAKVTG